MDFTHFVQWGFYSLMTGCVMYVVKLLASLEKSVEGLNIKIATIIERTSNHEKQIDLHDSRLRRLEISKVK